MNKKSTKIVILICLLVVAIFIVFYNEKSAENNRDLALTDREIYTNPLILHIRRAIDSYSNGSNLGLEDYTLAPSEDGDMKCGLDRFDKNYYNSKFIIWDAEPSKYGGMNADIVFIDKPDKIFWTWIYNIGENNNPEYVLRAFCENGPKDELKNGFPDMITAMVKDGKFPYSL